MALRLVEGEGSGRAAVLYLDDQEGNIEVFEEAFVEKCQVTAVSSATQILNMSPVDIWRFDVFILEPYLRPSTEADQVLLKRLDPHGLIFRPYPWLPSLLLGTHVAGLVHATAPWMPIVALTMVVEKEIREAFSSLGIEALVWNKPKNLYDKATQLQFLELAALGQKRRQEARRS